MTCLGTRCPGRPAIPVSCCPQPRPDTSAGVHDRLRQAGHGAFAVLVTGVQTEARFEAAQSAYSTVR